MTENKEPQIIHIPDDNKNQPLTYRIEKYSKFIDKNESNIIKSIIQVIYSSFDSFDEKKNKKLSDVISEEIKKRLGGEWFVFVTNANKEKQKIKFQISMFDEDDKSYLVINIGNSTFKIAKLK